MHRTLERRPNVMPLSDAVRSVRGADYLTDVGRRLAPHRNTSEVVDLFDLMADAGLPTP